jgi:hypothetical protein
MTDTAGGKDRPGAGPHCEELLADGMPLKLYLNYNPQSGRVEIARIMPAGVQDELVNDFPDEDSARDWIRHEVRAGRLPLGDGSDSRTRR